MSGAGSCPSLKLERIRPVRAQQPLQVLFVRFWYRGRAYGAAVALAIALTALLTTGTASASSGRDICVPVRLTGQGVATSATTTTATIFWNGRAIATTNGVFTPSGTSGDFTGSVVFTPMRLKGGTLVADVTGSYGPNFASFTAAGPVKGTGTLSRASGQLSFSGPIHSDGTFNEVITGKLCTDLRSW